MSSSVKAESVLPGVQTVVTDKSMLNLPTDTDREKESVLPSEQSATPRSHDDRFVPKYEYNRPDNDIDKRPRTLGEPGREYGHPSKDDYGMPTRRSMTAYSSGRPQPSRQRKQMRRKQKRDHINYHKNRSQRQRNSLFRYHHFCKRNQRCMMKRKMYREAPDRYKRKNPVSEATRLRLRRKREKATKRTETRLASGLGFHYMPFNEPGVVIRVAHEHVVFAVDGDVGILPVAVFSRVAAFDSEASFRRYVDAVVTIPSLDAATVHGIGALYGLDTTRLDFDGLTPGQLRLACDVMTSEGDGSEILTRYARQRRCRGQTCASRRKYYRKNKNRIRAQSKMWRRKNRNNPRHKRNVTHRRRFPAQHRRLAQADPDAPALVPEVEFSLAPAMLPASVNSVSPEDGDVTFTVWDSEIPEIRTLPLDDFIASAVFYTDEDSDTFFVMVDASIGEGAYDDTLDDEIEEELTSDDLIRLATGDVIMFDRAPPNNDVNKPGEDVAYDVTGPNMTVKTVDEKGGVPAGHGMPDTHTDDVPAASPRVTPNGEGQFFSGETTYLQASARFKMAVLMKDIRTKVPPDVISKARSIKPRLQRVDEKNGIYSFQVPSSKGSPYTVRLRPMRKGPATDFQKLDILVSCSCPFFQWQGPEHWAKANGFLYGKPRGTASSPDVKDPKGKHWACKHVISVFDMTERYGYQLPDLPGKVKG